MEGTTRLILFILLVTLSLVTGIKFTFSKKNYLEVLEYQKVVEIYTDPKKSPDITFYNTNEFIEWIRDPTSKQPGIAGDTLYLVPRKKARNKKPLPYFSIDNKSREELGMVTIYFSSLSEDLDAIGFGTLVIVFSETKKENPHRTFFFIDMFSPPETEEDTKYAQEVAEYVNPFPHYAMERIYNNNYINWKLSHIEKVISGPRPIKKALGNVNAKPEDNITMYGLKPIIVDKDQLIEYVSISNPNGKVRCITKDEEQGSTSGSAKEEAGGESIGAVKGEQKGSQS